MKARLERIIDIVSDDTTNIGTVRQLDSVDFAITLTGLETTENTTIKLLMKRSDDVFIEQDNDTITISGETITATFKPEATNVDGMVFLNAIVFDGTDRITTCKMYFVVQDILEGDAIVDNEVGINTLKDLDALILKGTADLDAYAVKMLSISADMDSLESRMTELEINGGGTGTGGEVNVDLTDYAKKSYVDNAISVISLTPGPVGPRGLAGAEGLQGVKGDAGEQGLQGAKGDIGIQGIQGEQGLKGDTGLTGTTGAKGDKGDKGDTGFQGIQGIQGLPGINGTDGADGVTQDLTNYYNKQEVDSAITNASIGGGEGVDLSSYATNTSVDSKISAIALTPGPQGTPGVDGIDGKDFLYADFTPEQLEALRGPQGIQGIQGETGLQGIQGVAGQDGADGTIGADGKSAYQIWLDNGHTGTELEYLASLVGAQGIQGIQGDKGADGTNGVDGATGAKGDAFLYTDFTAEQLQALKGAKGDKGDAFVYADFTPEQLIALTGPQGIQGIQGETGAAGADGVTQDLSGYVTTTALATQVTDTESKIPIKTSDIAVGSNLLIGTGVTKIEVVTDYPASPITGVLYVKVSA